MHGIRAHLALTTLLVLIIGQPVVAQSDEGGTTHTSDDGLATLAVPDGSIPEGTDITLAYRSSAEAPPELLERLGDRGPSHYEIQPADVTFDPPARFIRQVPLARLESTIYDPQVLGMLAARDGTGAWSWADDLGFEIDAATESLELSGDITSGGQVFALGTGVIWPGYLEIQGYVGEGSMTESDFYVQDFLGLPTTYEGHDAVITEAVGATGDSEVATAGEAVVTEVDYGPLVSLPFQCVSPGETSTELTYTLDGAGDDILIASWLELPAAPVEVSLLGSIECSE